jgi:hypothetical protein
MPLWAYALAAYLGLSILKIRTFLEHQAHERALGPHRHHRGSRPAGLPVSQQQPARGAPHAPQAALVPAAAHLLQQPDKYLRRNDGYRYASYAEIFRAT